MIHLICYAKIGDKKVAYHFSSNDKDMILAEQDAITTYPEFNKYSYLFGFHILTTDKDTFKSVSDLDPYFKDTKVIESFSEFLKEISI